jgi:propanediol dehydratase small subunit
VHALPLLVRDLFGVQRLPADSCTADEHVEPRQPVDRRVQLRRVTDVIPVRQVEYVDLGSTRAHSLDDGCAYAAGAPRDKSDAAGEVVEVGHRVFLYGLRVSLDPSRDYPLGTRRPDLVRTPGGIPLDELELHSDRVDAAELRATPGTLRLQAEIARDAGRAQLAENLLRAAELASLPDETILAIYTALRPRRSTAAELEAWAAQLESRDAPATASFVREAARVYVERGLLAG